MFEDEPRKLAAHEVGMPLDALGVEELQERIGLLEAEIARIRAAVLAREQTRSAADAAFKL